MRFFLFSLSVGLLLLPACNFRSGNTEAEVAPVTPMPLPDAPPVVAADPTSGPVETAPQPPPLKPEFTLDPAPTPPTEPSPLSTEESSTKPPSAEEVFNSVARVLRDAFEGSDDESDDISQGELISSIGRALRTGFQEASDDVQASDR